MILVMMMMIILETDYYYYPAVNMYSLFFTSLSQSQLFTLASMSKNHIHSLNHEIPRYSVTIRVRKVCVSVRVCTIYSTSFTRCLYICPYEEER